MFVVSIGNAFDGLSLYGPFESREDAEEYGEQEFAHKTDWVVVNVEIPQ